jgi:competence protein ComEC
VRPQAAVIQVGYRSRYGHPHPAVLARYAARGIAVHRADCEGGLAWSSAQPQAWRQARAQRWHYWRHTGGAGCAGTVLATAVQAPDADFEEDR